MKKLAPKQAILFKNPKTESQKGNIVELVELLKSVDINSAQAKLNITSISDNNGGRILL